MPSVSPLNLRRAVVPKGGGLDLRRSVADPPVRRRHPFASPQFEASGDGLAHRGAPTARPGEHQAHPFTRHSPAKPKLSPKSQKGRATVKAAFREVTENEPAIVGHTRKKFGAKRAAAQKTAIALSKARRAGVRIRKKR